MKFKKILMIGFGADDLGAADWERIRQISDAHMLIPKDSKEITAELAETDCLLVKLGATVDRKMMDCAPNLKYIGMFGTGYGKVDAVSATEKGITVCNIAGYSTDGVAELVFALILENIRDISRAKKQAKNGEYSDGSFSGYEIAGKNFGIVGLGRIGQRVAAIASAGFNANVSYWSKNRKPQIESATIKYRETVKDLLSNSDFVSINLAHTPETEKFFGSDLISEFKKNSVVINLSPMALLDIDALAQRLANKDFTFIFDHPDEITKEQAHLLSKYENCIMYPSIGYITDEATIGKKVMFVDNLVNYLEGKPSNIVN